jgi:ribosomal protein S18 acetylase RimI-like enzyme
MNPPEPARAEILPFHESFHESVVSLVKEILDDEYGSDVDPGADDDLKEIGTTYAPPDNYFVLALVGGKVVATGAILRISDSDCELRRLYVQAAHRRRGLASSIVAELVPFVVERGYKRILLEIRPEMADLSRIYQRYGFHESTENLPRPGKFMTIEL